MANRVDLGQDAPEIELYSDQKELFKLSEHKGENNVLVLFFPGAFTSVCTDELNMVNNDADRFGGDDLQVVGVSTDSPFALAEFKRQQGFSFPLLSDHDGRVADAYGAKYDNDFTPMKLDRIAKRSAFLVDKQGTVQYAEVLDNAGKMPDFDAIADRIASL